MNVAEIQRAPLARGYDFGPSEGEVSREGAEMAADTSTAQLGRASAAYVAFWC